MSRQIVKTIYQYDELNESAKERALGWYAQCVFYHEWWDCIYDDAQRIGLKIEEFDLNRNRHAKGYLINRMEDVCRAITKAHGKICGTHKLATQYLELIQGLKERIEADMSNLDESDESYEDDVYALESEQEDELAELKDEFEEALLEEYSVMLQKEAEYMQSREYLEEGIWANEYEFDEHGYIV